jgi:hypothetical protein
MGLIPIDAVAIQLGAHDLKEMYTYQRRQGLPSSHDKWLLRQRMQAKLTCLLLLTRLFTIPVGDVDAGIVG